MSMYPILRFKKWKAGGLGRSEQHNERKKEIYKSNKDIDPERSTFNYHVVEYQNRSYYHQVRQLIEEAHCPIVRSNSVVMVEALVTASPAFMQALPPEEQREYFERALAFIAAGTGGRKNIVSAVVHMDESNPHMHLSFCPINDQGKLSAKSMLGNQKRLSQWQTDYHQVMHERWPVLERGESSLETHRKHLPTWLFKSAERMDKQFDEVVLALDNITAFNAGKKRTEALTLLSKWKPEAEKFTAKLKQASGRIKELEERLRQSDRFEGSLQQDREELVTRLSEVDVKYRQLAAAYQKQMKLLDSIPPDILASIEKRQAQKKKERGG